MPRDERRVDLAGMLAVFGGAVVGSAARMVLHGADPVRGLAVANVLGCLLLGVVKGLLGEHRRCLGLFLTTGCLGAFTSWSSLAVQDVWVVGPEVAAGLCAVWVGDRFGAACLRSAS